MKNFTGKYDSKNRPILNGSILKNVRILGCDYKKATVYFDLEFAAFMVIAKDENFGTVADFLYNSITEKTKVK